MRNTRLPINVKIFIQLYVSSTKALDLNMNSKPLLESIKRFGSLRGAYTKSNLILTRFLDTLDKLSIFSIFQIFKQTFILFYLKKQKRFQYW